MPAIFRQLKSSIFSISRSSIATYGARIKKRTVAMWPVEIAAMATGETAYRNAAGIEIHEFFVNRFRSLDAVNIMMTGATKKKVVMRNCTLPKKTRDAVAVIATHVGVATDEPIPT